MREEVSWEKVREFWRDREQTEYLDSSVRPLSVGAEEMGWRLCGNEAWAKYASYSGSCYPNA